MAMAGEAFGRTADGQPVERYTLARGSLRVQVITLGAVIAALDMPDRHGRAANVVLGLPDVRATRP